MKPTRLIAFVIIFQFIFVEIIQAKDYIFVIDNSGSMRLRSHDANRRIPDSIIQFVELIDKEYPFGERISIIMFEKEARVLLPLTPTNMLIIDDKRTIKAALKELDYRGSWTLFGPAFDAFVKEMDLNASETHMILISDGRPDIATNKKINIKYIEDDIFDTVQLIKTKIKSNKKIFLHLFPFSKNYRTDYLKRFAYAANQLNSVKPYILRGEELFQRLKATFVFICADFPPGDVNFVMEFFVDDKDDVFSDVFDIIKKDLPVAYADIKFRRVTVKRLIDYDLYFETAQHPNVAFELMRKNKVNGMCMIYASDEQSFKYKILGCNHSEALMGFCKTRKQLGVDKELAFQFIKKYQSHEKQIIESVIPYDETSMTFMVKQNGDKLSVVENLRCRIVLMDPKKPDTVFSKYDLNDLSYTTDSNGIVTCHGIPRGVPLKFSIFPMAVFIDVLLAQKIITSGWKENTSKYTVEINDSEKNYPNVEVFAYAKPNEFSPSIARVVQGNVSATVEYRTSIDKQWQHLVKIKDTITRLDKKQLLLGYTYEIKATFHEFLETEDIQYEKDFLQTKKIHYGKEFYFKEIKIIYTAGRPLIQIPFYLNIPKVVRKNLSENLYSGKEIKLFNILIKFFKCSQQIDDRYCSFKLSTDLDIFIMLCEATSKMDFSPTQKIQLWGNLLATKFNCKNNNQIDRKTLTLTSAIIVLRLLEQHSEIINTKFKVDAEQTIMDIKNRNISKFLHTKIVAERIIDKFIK